MKKNHILKFVSLSFISFVFGVSFFGCQKVSKTAVSPRPNEVVVYAYDSFLSEWGPGPEIKKRFEEKTGLTLTFVEGEDAVSLLSKAILEKDDPQADVLIGLDQNCSYKALEADILETYKPENADQLIPESLVKEIGGNWKITPFDYSHFAIIYNTKSSVPAPKSLEDLTNPVYQKQIILMNPRTSTPGLGFVAWTVAVLGDNYLDYWKSLQPNILAMTPGWSAGWGMFEKGEAPLVISYATSPAATYEYNGATDYEALVFDEGHPIQVEGAAILKGAKNLEGAKKFMDFFISDDAQNVIPLTQWMYPANKNVSLPESYKKAAASPKKTVSADPKKVEEAVEKIMELK